jgi:hypothetical protein
MLGQHDAACPAVLGRASGEGPPARCPGVGPRQHGFREPRVQVVSVSEDGTGIKKIRPKGLLNILRAAGAKVEEDVEKEKTPEERKAAHEKGAAAFRRLLSR